MLDYNLDSEYVYKTNFSVANDIPPNSPNPWYKDDIKLLVFINNLDICDWFCVFPPKNAVEI